jgi:hypothetical protein
VEELLRKAAATDEAEDAQYGKGKCGDELPEELARRESRLKKIWAAKAELEQEAKEKAERQRAEAEARIAERRAQEAETGKKAGGRDPQVPDPEQAIPEAKAQLHRSGQPHHGGWGQQRQLYSGVQRAGGSGQ